MHGKAENKNSLCMTQRGRVRKIEYIVHATAVSSLFFPVRGNVTDNFSERRYLLLSSSNERFCILAISETKMQPREAGCVSC